MPCKCLVCMQQCSKSGSIHDALFVAGLVTCTDLFQTAVILGLQLQGLDEWGKRAV